MCRRERPNSARGRSSATACTGYPAWAWWKADAVDIYAVALDGRDVQLNSIDAGECFGICNLLVAEPLQTVLQLRGGDDWVRFWEKEALVAAMRGDAAAAMAYGGAVQREVQFLLSRIVM